MPERPLPGLYVPKEWSKLVITTLKYNHYKDTKIQGYKEKEKRSRRSTAAVGLCKWRSVKVSR